MRATWGHFEDESAFGSDAVLFRSLVLCAENLEGPAVTQPSPLVNRSGWS